ncbi:MAG TPA: tRNA (N6-isopentenyl adenosine(37)-C2)-methylthiotransferase MiaB [Elusimicrobia bacterium]|nr:tRNA (N6-isopentenyl adenosine(37)-C2)-methylthiotransferase MiaB [Elusimicrobiota bacterium]HBT60808.1 tRNA (N6-isopentenyl adenosine(37)-C2)-methylthiotransferase MiaB [Elusimicrobiota bacterium]
MMIVKSPRRVHAITLGCQMSAADSAETLSALHRDGWQTAATPAEADAVVVTTCAVRRHAEQRALSIIGALRQWKEADPNRALVVTGCMAQRLGWRLNKRFPHVDFSVGARAAQKTPQLVAESLRQRFGIGPSSVAAPASAATAFVTIMRGCSCSCSYCIVPAVRGPESCRAPEEILAEARAKVAAGAREITLLGQRVNAYLWKEGGRETGFADLLRLVDRVEGLRRLRFMSPHPGLWDDRAMAAFQECPSVCAWLHMPVQSGCDRILELMRRGYTRADYLRMIERVRRAAPHVVLSTDIIVGFPSETEEEFVQSLTLLEDIRPATAFCFKYSAREATPAAALPDDVPPQLKEERLARLNALVDRLTRETLAAQVGGVVEVLAETPTFGRTRTGFKVRWERMVAPGSLVSVRINAATRRTLLGDIHEP